MQQNNLPVYATHMNKYKFNIYFHNKCNPVVNVQTSAIIHKWLACSLRNLIKVILLRVYTNPSVITTNQLKETNIYIQNIQWITGVLPTSRESREWHRMQKSNVVHRQPVMIYSPHGPLSIRDPSNCSVLIALSQTFALFHMLSSNNRMTSCFIEVWNLHVMRTPTLFFCVSCFLWGEFGCTLSFDILFWKKVKFSLICMLSFFCSFY